MTNPSPSNLERCNRRHRYSRCVLCGPMVLALWCWAVLVTIHPELVSTTMAMSSKSSPKYLFYNIYLGGQNRIERIAHWVRSGGYTVAAFSELNGFTENTWSNFCVESLGLPFSLFLKTRHGYHMGLASSKPIEPLILSANKPFHHGIIYAWVPDLDHAVLVTHLSPTSSSAPDSPTCSSCPPTPSPSTAPSRRSGVVTTRTSASSTAR